MGGKESSHDHEPHATVLPMRCLSGPSRRVRRGTLRAVSQEVAEAWLGRSEVTSRESLHPRPPPIVRSKGRFQMRRCLTCGVEFERGRAKYCSPKCLPSALRYRKREWIDCPTCGQPFLSWRRRAYCSESCRPSPPGRPTPVSLDELGDLDGWRCHICGRKVNRAQASADHLVPHSLGGRDEWINLRLAHRRCNSRRGAGRLPAQLLLFG